MLKKPDFTKLIRTPQLLRSGVFTDPLSPEFEFGITVKPQAAYSDSTRLMATVQDLIERFVIGKWDEDADNGQGGKGANVPQALVTPDGQAIVIDEGVCNVVGTLLSQQSDIDQDGNPSPTYDEYELFRVSHRAPIALDQAFAMAQALDKELREKKDAKKTSGATEDSQNLPDGATSPDCSTSPVLGEPPTSPASIPASSSTSPTPPARLPSRSARRSAG